MALFIPCPKIAGKIYAFRLYKIFKSLYIKNCGIIVICGGIINVANTSAKITFFPIKLNLANPYPTREQTTVCNSDGAGHLRIFFKIAVPTAAPGYLISFLLSTVWYWNETYSASMYFGSVIQTLPMKLAAFVATFNKLYPGSEAGATANEAVKMAGTCLSLLPLLILYFFTQRWFLQ